jgi:hypothetical protein
MTITVGDLIRQLQSFPADADLTFSGGLHFYRLKTRGPNDVNVEFHENVYRTDAGEWVVEADPASPRD